MPLNGNNSTCSEEKCSKIVIVVVVVIVVVIIVVVGIVFPLEGRYLYVEMSRPRQPGDRAQLWSPIFPSTHAGKCFTFWYHMFGMDGGKYESISMCC